MAHHACSLRPGTPTGLNFWPSVCMTTEGVGGEVGEGRGGVELKVMSSSSRQLEGPAIQREEGELHATS